MPKFRAFFERFKIPQFSWQQTLFVSFLVTLFLAFVLPINSYDRGYWQNWSQTIDSVGILNIYSNENVNYPPLILYLLAAFNWILAQLQINFDKGIHLFKIFFIVVDFAVIWATISLLNQRKTNTAWAFLLLFNIGFWYNSLVFGQTDTLFTALGLFSLIFAYRSKSFWAGLFIGLAFAAKFQAVLWLPVVALALFYKLYRQPINLWFRKISLFVAGSALAIVAAFLPFALSGNLQAAINGSYITTVQNRFNELSVHAFNFWHLSMPVEKTKIDPSQIATLGLSYETIGYLLILITLVAVLFIYVMKCVHAGKLIKLNFSQLILLQGIFSLTIFFFSTRMHERYAHVAVISLLIYSALTKKIWLPILISLPYWLNLATVIEFSQGIMQGKFVGFPSSTLAAMYLAALGLSLYYWIISKNVGQSDINV